MDFNNVVLSIIYNNLPIGDLVNCSFVKEKYNDTDIKIIQENYNIVEYKCIYRKINELLFNLSICAIYTFFNYIFINV